MRRREKARVVEADDTYGKLVLANTSPAERREGGGVGVGAEAAEGEGARGGAVRRVSTKSIV